MIFEARVCVIYSCNLRADNLACFVDTSTVSMPHDGDSYDEDTWSRVSRLDPVAAAAAATCEAVQMWTILEVSGCAHSHPLPFCSDACLEDFGGEGWRLQPTCSVVIAQAPERDAAHVGLMLGAALERAGRRSHALAALARAVSRAPTSARARLALAKLLFRAGRKTDAGDALVPLVTAACNPHPTLLDAKTHFYDLDALTAGDALYIAGWVRVHADSHSEAYELWGAGALALPGDVRLSRQAGKVAAWGGVYGVENGSENENERASPTRTLASPPIALSVPFSTPLPPALSLFHPSQGRAIAFISPSPLISPAAAAAAISAAEAHVAARNPGGVWGTVRNSSVPTSDVAVEDIPALVPWLRDFLRASIFPFVAACFPALADGSKLTPDRLRVHDAFIVRYDVDFGSTTLPEHSDTSAVSLSIALNQEGADFDGGGLSIRALRGAEGVGLSPGGTISIATGHGVAFAGPARHGGALVTQGTRFILVLFLYVQGFEYGSYIEAAKRGPGAAPPEGRDDDGGFVVYRETKTLMEALESGVVD